jgi:hypothetical protein
METTNFSEDQGEKRSFDFPPVWPASQRHVPHLPGWRLAE